MLNGVSALFFYFFSFIMLASSCIVISARNPVHSALCLILVFFNAAGLFLLAGAEFLAMILLVVYVGAVAILFLFVVMMIDIDFSYIRKNSWNSSSFLGLGVGCVLAFELAITFYGYSVAGKHGGASFPPLSKRSNTAALGDVLYTDYFYFFQLSGFILLVAIIGAIVLTLSHKPKVKSQDIVLQVARTPATSIEIKKIEPGKGI